MAQIRAGYQFSGTAPNNVADAAKLNALVALAEILPGLITDQVEETVVADDDYFLIFDSSVSAFRKVAKGSFVQSSIALAGTRNLWAANNAVTPNSQVDVSADEIVLRRSSNGDARLVRTFAATADLTVYSSGPTLNGRDHATLTDPSWIYLHAISDGTTNGLIFSQSATSPILPAGYNFSCLLGAFRYVTAALRKTVFRDDRQHLVVPVSTGAQSNVTTNNDPTSATGYTALSIATLVPPTARLVRGYLSTNPTSTLRVIIAGSNAGLGAVAIWAANFGSIIATRLSGTEEVVAPFEVPIATPSTLFWKHASNDPRQFWITGYQL